MSSSHVRCSFVLAGLAAVASPFAFEAPAAAQPVATGMAIDRFDPSERGSEWFVLDTLDLRGHLRPALGAVFDWAHKPLVLYDANGNQVTSIVSDQVFVHLGGSLVFWDRLRLGVDLPLAIYENGHSATLGGVTYPAPQSPAAGDLRLGADVRIVGRYRAPFTLAAGASLYLPTGTRDAYTGDGDARAVVPHVNASGEIGVFAYAAKIGLQVRRSQILAGARMGNEVVFGAAIGLRVLDERLLFGPELYGSTVVEGDIFRKASTPLEVLFGWHYELSDDWRAGVGFGPGILRGDGSPLYRIVASIEWAPAYNRRSDRDRDGIPDSEDACPDTPGKPNLDPTKNGCPVARIEEQQIKIIDQVKFRTDSAEILTESDEVLTAVADVLKAHPEIKKLRIEGHTDATGEPGYNEDLSRRRAEAVSNWLAQHGIDKERLQSAGFGQNRPIDTNDTMDGRRNNRRVEFHLVEGHK